MRKIDWYHAIIGFGLWFIVSNVLGLIFLSIAGSPTGSMEESIDFQFTVLGLGVSSLSMFISFVSIPIVYFLMLGKKPALLMDIAPIKGKAIILSLVGMFAFGFLIEGLFAYIIEANPNFNKSILGLIDDRFYNLFGDLDFHRRLYELFQTDSFFIFLLLIVFVGVLPGIGEEFFFRGFMQRILMNKTSFFVAILLSGGLFGIIHSVQDMSQALGAFLISFYLGYIYMITKNLWIPIICHIANNSLMGTLAYLFPDLMMGETAPSLIPILISLPIGYLVVVYFKRNEATFTRELEKDDSQLYNKIENIGK